MHMKIAIACDPAGMPLKGPIEETLTELGIEYVDLGMHEGDCRDYPVFALRVANKVVSKECDMGIVLCGTGVGISIAANKVDGIRCCHCSDCYTAKMSRAHNDANMLALGGRVIAPELAKMIVEIFVKGEFEGGRHQTRIDMFKIIEQGGQLE